MRGPQRFTDLLRYAGGITPKWLTQRLRDLERAGIVERDSAAGRREVWYRLTAKGRDLGPVVDALTVWGMDHAMRPPLKGEAIFPEQTLRAITTYLNRNGHRPRGRVLWQFDFVGASRHVVSYDGATWRTSPGESDEAPDLIIETNAVEWVRLLTAPVGQQRALFDGLALRGPRTCVRELLTALSARGMRSMQTTPDQDGSEERRRKRSELGRKR